MLLGVLAQLVNRRAVAEDMVTEFVRAAIGAPLQRAPGREVDTWRRARLVHSLHVDVVEAHSDAQLLAESIDADRAMLVELGLRSGGDRRLHGLACKGATIEGGLHGPH